MTQEEAIEVQKKELKTLLGEAHTLLVGRKPVLVKEPTLAVLDKMSQIFVEIPDLSEALNEKNAYSAINEAKQLLPKFAKKLSKALAICILGEKCFGWLGNWRIRRKTRHIYKHITPLELQRAAEFMTVNTGLVNFIVSMRLMSTATTTTPTNGIE